MKIICAWCQKDMGDADVVAEGANHGICEGCSTRIRKEIEDNKK